jgi:hypothetical protein
MYFYPCVPPEARDLAALAPFASRLPPCNGGAADPTALNQLAMASAGRVRTRGAQNLELSDPDVVVAAVVDYLPTEVIEQSFQFEHVAAR